MGGQGGALLSVPKGSAGGGGGGGVADGDAEGGAATRDSDDDDAAAGCVALWSLKNQFHPVWSFKTKSGGGLQVKCCRVYTRVCEASGEPLRLVCGSCVVELLARIAACRRSILTQLCPAATTTILCRCHQPGLFAAQPAHAGCGHA